MIDAFMVQFVVFAVCLVSRVFRQGGDSRTESTCAIPVKDNRVDSKCSLLRTGGQTQQVPRQRSPLEPVPTAFDLSRWCPLLGCFCLSILQLQSKTSPLRV